MKNVIDFTSSASMYAYFLKWRAKGCCIYGAYRYRGKQADYYISNVNSHVSDFVVFVIPPGKRFTLSCEKHLIVGTFLFVLQFLHFYESSSIECVTNSANCSGDDLPF